MVDIAEHCLVDPVQKLDQIREHFHHVILNFEDVRNFDTVEKCREQLPDEVAAAHCILHQAVLLVTVIFFDGGRVVLNLLVGKT